MRKVISFLMVLTAGTAVAQQTANLNGIWDGHMVLGDGRVGTERYQIVQKGITLAGMLIPPGREASTDYVAFRAVLDGSILWLEVQGPHKTWQHAKASLVDPKTITIGGKITLRKTTLSADNSKHDLLLMQLGKLLMQANDDWGQREEQRGVYRNWKESDLRVDCEHDNKGACNEMDYRSLSH